MKGLFQCPPRATPLGIMAVNKTPCKGKSLLFRGKMKFFEKKVKKDAEKFGGMEKKHYLCTRF